MAKFDLGAFAKTLQAVPETGTEGPERIEYIPLDQLHEDSRNFYAVSGVEELAANIQLCGLMDPLRVSKAEDGYTIVSGHPEICRPVPAGQGGSSIRPGGLHRRFQRGLSADARSFA